MITAFSFGRMVIDGVTYNNDVKIIQNTVVPDWWRKRGHSVDVDDVHDILNYHPDILVIGKGDPGFMTTSPDLQKVLEQKSIELIEQQSKLCDINDLSAELIRSKSEYSIFNM